VKRTLAIALACVVLVASIAVGIGLNVRDPEVSNPVDAEDMPDSYASDASLLKPGSHRIQERVPATADRSAVSTPYFIELSDGRYACGYTDAGGNTRALFTRRPVAYKVYWDDEAWAKWLAARGRPRPQS
jgi:hypothetical protein